MATSNYGFPCILNNISYNRNHVKKALVLSDVPPKDMLALLKCWGVRPKPAYLLVDIYGGHVLQISQAICELYDEQEKTKIGSSFISGLRGQLIRCIAESKVLKIEKEVKKGLSTLMETGFNPCEFISPVSDLFTKCNVAGFIEEDAKIPGLSSSFQYQLPGLVPSTQMIRVVFALSYKKLFSADENDLTR
jgi:hypothetical protein